MLALTERARSLLLPKEFANGLGFTLRDRQREVVVRFVRCRDMFVSLPTVSGKILYQAMSVSPGHLTR